MSMRENKKGDRPFYVICTNPRDGLTKGELYPVLQVSSSQDTLGYLIKNDHGNEIRYWADRFEGVSDEQQQVELIKKEIWQS